MKQKFPDPILEPSDKTKAGIYKLYKAIFKSDIFDTDIENEKYKIKLMTPIFSWYPWSWRVVGISEDAFRKIKRNKFSRPKKIQRDHFLQGRAVTYKKMIRRDEPLELEEWWHLFWENDRTIIMTKEENDIKDDKEKDKIKCLKLNWEDGYFYCNPLVGFKYGKATEGEYLKTLKVKPVTIKTIKRHIKNK